MLLVTDGARCLESPSILNSEFQTGRTFFLCTRRRFRYFEKFHNM